MSRRLWDTTLRFMLALGALLVPCMQGYAGESSEIQLPWSDLGARIMGRKVAIVLPDGTHIQGKVQEVAANGVRLKVSRTSDRKVLSKGEHVVPLQSLSVVQVTEYRGLGRLLVTAGAAAVAGGIAAASYPDVYEGLALVAVPAVVAAGVAGAAVGGYFVGKRVDKRVTEIHILPEQGLPGRPSPGR